LALLNQVLAKSFRGKKPARPGGRSTKKNSSRSLTLFSTPRGEKKLKGLATIELAKSVPIKANQQTEVLPRVLVPPSESADLNMAKKLQTADLIFPKGAVKSSIDGFILDQRSEHTKRAYAKDYNRFMKFLIVRREKRGSEILDRKVIIAYKDWLLQEELQPTTVDRHLSTLRSMFEFLVEDDVIEKNPAGQVRFLKPKRFSRTNAFSDAEVVKMLGVPNLHTRTGAMHYAILTVLFYCGLRRAELCSLRTNQIFKERGYRVFRFEGKGGKERFVPIQPAVWNALKYYFVITSRHPGINQPLFAPIKNNRTKIFNKPVDPSMIYYIVKKTAALAGIQKKVSPHSCRATAISNARDRNVSDRAIQEFAGWSSTEMITRYDKRRTAIEDSAAHSITYGDFDYTDGSWVARAKRLWSEWDEAGIEQRN